MDAKYMRLLKDTGIFAVGNLGSKLILFLLMPLYTNFMTTDEYGTSDLVFTIAQLVIPFTSLVIFDSVQRFGLSKYEKPENVLLCGMIVCAVGGVVALALTPLFDLYGAISEWRWYLSVYVVLNMFESVETNYLKARDKNKLFALISILQTLVLALCNIVFLCWNGMGIKGYLLSMCIASLVSVVGPLFLGGVARDLRNAQYDRSLMRRMCSYSIPLVLTNLSWWGIHSADKVIVELFLGSAALGIFTVATRIPSLINVIVNTFTQAWRISTVKEIESTDETAFYSDVLGIYQFLAFGASVVLVAIIEPFMSVYVGPDFGESWKYVPLLLVGASFSAIGEYYGSIYNALLKSINSMISTVVSALVNVLIGIVCIPFMGIWGAVISVYLSYVVLALYRLFDTSKYLSIDYGGWRFFANALVVTVQACCISAGLSTAFVSPITLLFFIAINWCFISKLLGRRNK